ncbi:MAG: hypothetical protein QOI66_4104, partial [Myxococcales bacterium]|nr:hypothetical protein [Myxococcales bacterium]
PVESRRVAIQFLDRVRVPELSFRTSKFQTRTVTRGGPMGGSDKRKQSLYFPEEMLKEIQEEATRQDRSLSWIVQKAWKISRKEIMKYPSVNEFPGEEDERGATE